MRGVSFAVAAGEVFGLLGPNGAGKDDDDSRADDACFARRTAARSWPATTSAANGLAVREAIGYIPQAISIDGALTARENLEFYAPRHRRAAERATRADRAGGRGDGPRFVPRPARTQRCRAACCAVSRSRPRCSTGREVLFLDEPTVGLDPTARRLVWERLEALREEAGTTLARDDAPDGRGGAPVRADRDHGSRHARRAGHAGRALRAQFDVPTLDEVFTAATGHAIERRRELPTMSAPAADFRAGSAEPLRAGVVAPAARLRDGIDRDGLGGAAQAPPRPPRHRHALGAAAALAVHLRHCAAAEPRARRRLPRLPRVPRARA